MKHTDLLSLITIGVSVVTLAIIMTERVNDTAAALFGFAIATLAVHFIGGYPFLAIAQGMGWDVILLVTAMMIIVAVMASSGLFQWIAVIIAARTMGNPRRVFIYFMIVVFSISLFFIPLPTMLIVSTFTVEVCDAIDVDFRPYLITEAVISGIGVLSTPIGSVPNLLIIYYAGIDTVLLFATMFPLSIILFAITMYFMLNKYSDTLSEAKYRDLTALLAVNPSDMIRSRTDFRASIIGMAILVIGFIALPKEAAMIALVVAAGLLVISRDRARDLLRHLAWDAVFFLVGMMGIVQTLAMSGVIESLAFGFGGIAEANVFIAIFVMIWVPGMLMSPLDAKAVGILITPASIGLRTVNPMIAISLGAGINIGGYSIPFGDTPNMVVVNISEEHHKPLSWREFNKAVIPVAIIHLIVTTVYCIIISLFL